jgi:hypothetical protein
MGGLGQGLHPCIANPVVSQIRAVSLPKEQKVAKGSHCFLIAIALFRKCKWISDK